MTAIVLIITLTLGIVVAPTGPEARPRGTIPRIGVLEPGSRQQASACLPAFLHGLRHLGYVEGHNLRLDYRYADDKADRLAARAAKQTTTTIPIVVGVALDLVHQGVVASLRQPGGNLTGMELQDIELLSKRLALFKEALPPISRVAVLVNPTVPSHAHVPRHSEPAARALGVQLQRVEAGAPEDFEEAFATMVRGRADALLIMDTALFAGHRQQLAALALRHRLPTMTGGRHFTEAGSLLAYGAYAYELCQRSAVLVDKILKGATPADLPVEQPAKYYLVINLRTAQALGLTLPPMVLFQADEVIK